MPQLYWQLLDPTLPIWMLHPDDTLLVTGPRRSVVATVRPVGAPDDAGRIRQYGVFFTVLPDLLGEAWLTPQLDDRLTQLARLLGVGSPSRVITIPPVRKPRGWFRNRAPHIATSGRLHLDGTNILEYAEARVRGERPEPPTNTARREAIRARAATVIDDHAARRSDVAYRIENSALFDASVPTTHALEVAMVRWEAEAGSASLEELDDLASELEIAYAVARDHAETVGFGHLPGAKEADARRAAKAARLAASATSEGERLAAQQQVVRILESLALHYLPTAEAKRLALPRGSH